VRLASQEKPAVALVYAVPVFLAVVRLIDAGTFESWMREDGWAEWATFAGFLAAGALFFRSAGGVDLERKRDRRLAQVVLVLLGLFCVFVAGEEISWGQRLLGLTPPDAFLESNYQQELNLHNLKRSVFGIPTESRFLVAYFCVIYGLLGPPVGRALTWIAPSAPPLWLAPIFGVVTVVELTYPVDLGGEAAELALALAMVASAPRCRPRPRAVIIAAVIAAGPALAFSTAWAFGADKARAATARAELEALGMELTAPGAVKPRLFKKKSVHKRVFSARKKYLRLAGEDRYFIDPWGNPYWLHARRGRGTVWLYSFGPNRKRDLRPGSDEPGGDDVLVEVTPREPAAD
jgi:hypothetical protein